MTDTTVAPPAELADQAAEERLPPNFDPGQHHWLHIDPNGDHWLEHPVRDGDPEDRGCHYDLANQCPVHLHVAHRRVSRHPELGFEGIWRSKVPGAPHHLGVLIHDYAGDTITVSTGPEAEPITAELHEPHVATGVSVVVVNEAGGVAFTHPVSEDHPATEIERRVRAKVAALGTPEPGEYWIQHTPWALPERAEDGTIVHDHHQVHLIRTGQRG